MHKIVYVAAAVMQSADGKILLAQRPAGKPMAGLWEFPGGKIEHGETPEQALCREIGEELGVTIDDRALTPLSFVSYAYEGFHLVMLPFLCRVWTGDVAPREGQALDWVLPADLGRYPMPPADIPLLQVIADECG